MLITEIMLTEMYTAYVLDKKDRQKLADIFPPKYDEFVGHHITRQFGVSKDAKIPSNPKKVEVVGYADDGSSIEALVVSVNGNITRPDGGTYHITWSLDRNKGRKPVHSNNLIKEFGYTEINPILISPKPELLK